MTSALVLFAAFYLALALHGALSLAFGRLLGAEVRVVAIGWFRIVRLTLGGTELRLGLLPLSSWAEVAGRAPGESGNWWQLP